MKTKPFLICFFILLAGCNDKGSSGNNQTVAPPSPTGQQNIAPAGEETILNNIVLQEGGGLEISSAFLKDDAGRLINPQNIVSATDPVYLTLQIKKGWKIKKGFVSPGAVQTITTHNGEPVLQSSDLFAGSKRIKAKDAATLQLKAVISSTRSDIKYYVVRFRVWDKLGPGEVAGYYHLRVEK